MAFIKPHLYAYTGSYTGRPVAYSSSYHLDDQDYMIHVYANKIYSVSGPEPDTVIAYLERECRNKNIVPGTPKLTRLVLRGCVGHPVDVHDIADNTRRILSCGGGGEAVILYALGGTVTVRATGKYRISTRTVDYSVDDFRAAMETALTPPYTHPVIPIPLAKPVRR